MAGRRTPKDISSKRKVKVLDAEEVVAAKRICSEDQAVGSNNPSDASNATIDVALQISTPEATILHCVRRLQHLGDYREAIHSRRLT